MTTIFTAKYVFINAGGGKINKYMGEVNKFKKVENYQKAGSNGT